MQRQPFNSDWRFHHGEPIGHDWWWMEPDTTTWRTVDLPHDWSVELPRKADNPSGVSNGFFEMGRGYYRKSITPAEDWRGKKVFVEFEGVYMNAEIWLDEHFLVRHPYGYTSFLVDLTPFLKIGEKQSLKVRVDNSAQLNSRWYSGSGIYRPVWLIVSEPVRLAQWGVAVTTPEVSPSAALLHAAASVINETETAAELTIRSRGFAPDGSPVGQAEAHCSAPAGQTAELAFEIPIANPLLWSPETPHLYCLETEVYCADRLVDSQSVPFGVRSIAFSAEQGFFAQRAGAQAQRRLRASRQRRAWRGLLRPLGGAQSGGAQGQRFQCRAHRAQPARPGLSGCLRPPGDAGDG